MRVLIPLAVAAIACSLPQVSSAQRWKGNWERLGCDEVGRRSDRDVIRVGRREGRFKAIRLTASGNDVQVQDLKVVYANGRPDDISVRRRLREGEESAPLDLKGRDRAIQRIELRTQRDFKGPGRGPARVCVLALEDDRGPNRR